MKHNLIVATCVAGILMSACATQGPNETNGTLIGAGGGTLAGGLIGSAFGGGRGALLGMGLGAVGGGLGGNIIGRNMDQEQRARDYERGRYEQASYDQGYYRY
jgi:uncharacterized protein YcfJ